jgi:hypothetical protein
MALSGYQPPSGYNHLQGRRILINQGAPNQTEGILYAAGPEHLIIRTNGEVKQFPVADVRIVSLNEGPAARPEGQRTTGEASRTGGLATEGAGALGARRTQGHHSHGHRSPGHRSPGHRSPGHRSPGHQSAGHGPRRTLGLPPRTGGLGGFLPPRFSGGMGFPFPDGIPSPFPCPPIGGTGGRRTEGAGEHRSEGHDKKKCGCKKKKPVCSKPKPPKCGCKKPPKKRPPCRTAKWDPFPKKK